MIITFIGAGNMGSALAKAVCKKVGSNNVYVCDTDAEKARQLADQTGCNVCNIETAASGDYIFLAVKPQSLSAMFSQISDILKSRKNTFTLVSMAAGQSIEKICSFAGFSCPVIRIMPNVACTCGEGMTLCCKNDMVTDDAFENFIDIMQFSGKVDKIEEKQIDNYSIVSGCGPAYVYLMIEALADGQVAIGVPRDKAYLYASQMVKGAAEHMITSHRLPADLKDSVCSPGGTTIEGVKALEKGAFRSDIIEAVKASYEKTLKM